jgi:hypothetical protein
MLLEAVQTVAEVLAAAGTGVNALRTTVPLYVGDTAPPAVTVVQQFRDGDAARGQAAQTGVPVLEVSLWQDPAQTLAPAVRPFPMDGEVQVAVRYCAAETTDSALAVRNAALTLRVVARVLAAAFVGGRTVNDVQFLTATNLRTLAMYVTEGDTLVTGALVVTLRGRDLWTHPT